MSHHFLILYDLIPENLKVFRLSTDDDALAEQIRSCHREYGNSTNTEDELQTFINEQANFGELIYSDESEADILNFKTPPQLTFDPGLEIIHTGFFL